MKKLLFLFLVLPFLSNAITPTFTCGFEEGVSGTGTHWATVTAATFSTTQFRSGNRAMRVNGTNIDPIITSTATSIGNIIVGRFYVYMVSSTGGGINLVTCNVGGVQAGVVLTGGGTIGIAAQINNSSPSVTTINANQWYRVDFKIDASANPWTCDVKLDGISLTQQTAANTAATFQSFSMLNRISTGHFSGDVYVDDVIVSYTAGDYPIGGGYVNHFVPTSDGTHNVAGANDFEFSLTGTDITNATTTAYTLLDDVPLESGTPTDFINLVAPPNSTDYVECIYGVAPGINTPTSGPRCISVLLAVAASSTTTNNLNVVTVDNGTTDIIFNNTVGSTTIRYTSNFYATAINGGGAWTVTSGAGNFNDLRLRCSTSDAAPDPYVVSAMIEAEFEEQNLTVPGTPSDKRHTTLGVGYPQPLKR